MSTLVVFVFIFPFYKFKKYFLNFSFLIFLLRSNTYSRIFRKVRGFCRGFKHAQRRSEGMLRYMNMKRRSPGVGSADLLKICRNTLRFCKFYSENIFTI